jgi:hypothetical protein
MLSLLQTDNFVPKNVIVKLPLGEAFQDKRKTSREDRNEKYIEKVMFIYWREREREWAKDLDGKNALKHQYRPSCPLLKAE